MPSGSATQSALLQYQASSSIRRRTSPSRAPMPERQDGRDSAIAGGTAEPVPEFSRVTGYHNAMAQDDLFGPPSDSPPSYHDSQIDARLAQVLSSSMYDSRRESLPGYTCTVQIEGPLSMKLEKTSPFEPVANPQWSEVYCTLQGTLLKIHQSKSSAALFGKPGKDKKPGKHIKSYTLQHAEVGIAADHKKIELVPRVHFATLLPQATLQLLQMSEPQMFTPVRQYVIRLRLESDQLLLRFDDSDSRAEWIDKLCQAVDISQPLEVRTEPKYHTLPRRRRRRHGHGERQRMDAVTITNDAAAIREQERMIREFFPQLQEAQTPVTPGEELNVRGEVVSGDVDVNEVEGGPQAATGAPDPDQDDLDREFVLDGDSPGRPISRLEDSAGEESREDSPTDQRPATAKPESSRIPKRPTRATMDAAMAARYRRRCMPSLLYNSRRAEDVLVTNGKRWKIDWDMRELKPLLEPLPEYQRDDSSERSDSSEESPAARTLRQFLKLAPTTTSGSTNSSFTEDAAVAAHVKTDRPQRPPTVRTNSGKELQGLTQRLRRMTSRKPQGDADSSVLSTGS